MVGMFGFQRLLHKDGPMAPDIMSKVCRRVSRRFVRVSVRSWFTTGPEQTASRMRRKPTPWPKLWPHLCLSSSSIQ
eukprot:4841105-Amphidinium_carterae.1